MRENKRTASRLRLLLWLGAVGFAVFGSLFTLWLLGSSVYSAPAFVTRYLEAVAHDNIAEAVAMPGVALSTSQRAELGYPESTSDALLRPGVMASGPQQVHVTLDTTQADGSHIISVEFRLAGSLQSAQYQVTPEPALLGVIPRWRFSQSPLALLNLTVQNGSHFNANALTFDVRNASAGDPAAPNPTGNYLVAGPVELSIGYSSELIEAPATPIIVRSAAQTTASVLVLPTPILIERVQSKLDGFLTECAAQHVLQPSGCPFGTSIDDRVVGDPNWTLIQNPVVSLTPDSGGFIMPGTAGVAHVSVPIQRLYDGELSTVETNVDYGVELTVKVFDDGSIAIQLH